MTKPHLRVGVVAVVRRDDGKVLAFERSDHTGEWQLPQGGVEPGEDLRDAAWRELGEETGLDEDQVELVTEHEDWTVYLWPASLRKGGRLGQAHRWFFFRPTVGEIHPVPDGREFRDWTWMDTTDLVERVVEFRRQPYRQVLGG